MSEETKNQEIKVRPQVKFKRLPNGELSVQNQVKLGVLRALGMIHNFPMLERYDSASYEPKVRVEGTSFEEGEYCVSLKSADEWLADLIKGEPIPQGGWKS